MTLDLDNVYKILLGRGPTSYGGGTIQDSAREYWNNQYTAAGGGDAGLASVISGVKGSQEYKDLGLGADFDHAANPLAAQHRVQAKASINRGEGVRDGTVASYSDMFNADGTQRSDWTNEKDWLQQKVYDQHAAGSQYDDSALREMIGGLTGQLGDLRSAFDDYKTQSASDMQNMWNNANWGWGQTVGGVRTQNELPGWAPKKGGTSGFFGRGGRSGKGLTTSSLNI